MAINSILPCSSLIVPLYLPYISPISPLYLPQVIGHMAINSILLVYSLYIENGNFVEFWKLKEHESRTQG